MMKRFIIPNISETLTWGHSDITFYQTDTETTIQLATNALNEFVNDSDQNESNIEIINDIALRRTHLSHDLADKLNRLLCLMMKDLENEYIFHISTIK